MARCARAEPAHRWVYADVAAEREKPVVERVGIRLAGMYRNVGENTWQHLVAGYQEFSACVMPVGVLGCMPCAHHYLPAVATDSERFALLDAPVDVGQGDSSREKPPKRQRLTAPASAAIETDGVVGCRAPGVAGQHPALQVFQSCHPEPAPVRRVSQPAMSKWSRCRWVTRIRVSRPPASGTLSSCFQSAKVSTLKVAGFRAGGGSGYLIYHHVLQPDLALVEAREGNLMPTA